MRCEGFEGERAACAAVMARDHEEVSLGGKELRHDPVAAAAPTPEEDRLRLTTDVEEEPVGLPFPTQHDEAARSVHGQFPSHVSQIRSTSPGLKSFRPGGRGVRHASVPHPCKSGEAMLLCPAWTKDMENPRPS